MNLQNSAMMHHVPFVPTLCAALLLTLTSPATVAQAVLDDYQIHERGKVISDEVITPSVAAAPSPWDLRAACPASASASAGTVVVN